MLLVKDEIMTFARSSKYLYLAGGVVFILFYFLFDPIKYGWMPQCLFYRITGLQCMGCGSQRVIHSLLHGDISGAWQANAFLVLSLPFLIFLLGTEFYRTRHPYLYAKIHSKATVVSVTVLLFIWFVLRNILSI